MKKICFKLGEFPNVSETFIVNQIQYAIDLDFQILILVTNFKKDNTPFFEVFLNQEIVKKNIEIIDYNIPKSKFKRLLIWLKLMFFNIKHIGSIIGFYSYLNSYSLSNLFKWCYYFNIVKENDIVTIEGLKFEKCT